MKNQFERDCYAELVKEYGKNNVLYEPVGLSYTSEHIYTPDFGVYVGNDVFYVESKGYLRSDNRRTLLAVRKGHLDIDLKLCFQRNQKLYKGSKSRYSDWAEANGFDYCIGAKAIKDLNE